MAQTINLEDAETFAAPEHLVPHFNGGEIDYEQLAVLSAKHYLAEADAAAKELNAIKAKNEVLQGLVADSATEKANLKAKLSEFDNQKLALAMARNELADQQARILGVEAVESANTSLAAKVQELESTIEANKPKLAQLNALQVELNALIEERDHLSESLETEKANNRRLESLASAHEVGVKDLRNTIATATKRIGNLTSNIEHLKLDIKNEKDTSAELRQIIKDNASSLDEAKVAVNTVAATILRLDKNQKALDKENRLLSLYVNAHTTAPMLETPQGHQLKALMFDKNQIISNSGDEVIRDNTALFQWVNPNGFSCLVALSANEGKNGKDNLLLMPSLVDENIAGKLTPTGKKVAKNLTDSIAPPKEYYDLITQHIKDFKVDDFKKAMLKAFARATYLSNETEHLQLEAENGLSHGDIRAMREMSLSHDRMISRNIARSKAALRAKANPHKKAGKSKKRR